MKNQMFATVRAMLDYFDLAIINEAELTRLLEWRAESVTG